MANLEPAGPSVTPAEALRAWADAAMSQMTAERITSNKDASPKVSVLVPVFNAERYLEMCLDSLIAQTLGDIEIICIDDGSTDGSAAILGRYAAEDARVHVITKSNTGYGDSMNRGLEAARGVYIGICEPDDYADTRMYELLYQTALHTKSDIVKSGYLRHTTKGDETYPLLVDLPFGKQISCRTNPELLLVEPSIWTAIYRREMIRGNRISFTPSPGASFQDSSFAHQCLVAAERIVLLRGSYLHYRVDNPDASSKSSEKVFAVCDEFNRSFDFMRVRNDGSLELLGPWLNVMRHGTYIWNYNRIAADHHQEFAERWLEEMRVADESGLLDRSLMTAGYRTLLDELFQGAASFAKRYPDVIPVPPVR